MLDRPDDDRRLVVGIAAIVVLAEIASVALRGTGSIWVGRIPVSLAVLPGLVLLAAVGPRRLLGHKDWSGHPVVFWVVSLGVLVAAAILFTQGPGQWREAGGLFAAALAEELVYRLAAPVFIAALLVRVGVRVRLASITGFVAAGVWWILLPGHVDQMHRPMVVAAFVAAAVLFALVVIRSGSLLAATVVHATMNLLTFAQWGGIVDPAARQLVVAILLGLMVFVFAPPRRRRRRHERAEPDRPDDVIDLRDRDDEVVDLRDEAAASEAPDTVTPQR